MSFGKLQQVENLDPKTNSNKRYTRVLVMGPDGLETLMLTEHEIERVRQRVKRNPEDTKMVPSWWDKLAASFSGIF